MSFLKSRLSTFVVLLIFLCTISIIYIFHATPAYAAAADTMTIENKSGSTIQSYPLQFARPFLQDEFPNGKYPQIVVNGTPVVTQVDVKQRYPNQSIKHAILSAVVTLPANTKLTITFAQQTSSNNTPLTQAEMLDPAYNFDAVIKLTSGTSVSASARTMLTNGDYTVWTSGPIATTILLADDSVNRKYDMGFNGSKPIRPRFYATFWPATHQVFVRYVGEDTVTTSAQNVTYNLDLYLGQNSTSPIYTKSNVSQGIMTRWTRTFWLNGTPAQQVNVNHNIAYLKETKFIPNYDASLSVPTGGGWGGAAHGIFDAGLWDKRMPNTGGRPDIGPFTTWSVRWMYTGDWQDRDVAFGQQDLAGAWPMQAREGDVTKKIDKAQTISGLGMPASAYAHQVWAPTNTSDWSQLALGLGVPNDNGWERDSAHQPNPGSIEYLLSGDYYYLEQLQFWAAADATGYDPYYTPTAAIDDQVRGNAWVLRDRAYAALLTPDSMASLKNFYLSLTDDALAYFEGRAGISGTALQGNSNWTKGKNNSWGTNPLHFVGCDGYADAGLGGGVNCPIANFQHDYFLIVLGMLTEAGFNSGPFFSWAGKELTGQFVSSGYNPYNIESYWTIAQNSSGTWFATWADYQTANVAIGDAVSAKTAFSGGSYYPTLAMTAASFLAGTPDGATAWNWLSARVPSSKDQPSLWNGQDPTWSIYPRTVNSNPAPLPSSTTVTPPPPPPPPTPLAATATISASPTSITSGQSTMLSWGSTNATACVGTNFTAGSTAGALSVKPDVTTTYSVTCTGTGGSGSASVQVAVGAVSPPPPPPPPTTPPPPPPPTSSSCLNGTNSDDTLMAAQSTACVDGGVGTDTVKLTYPGDMPSSWVTKTANSDGSVTITDVHATGYAITLRNIEVVIYPSGETENISSNTASVSPPPPSVTPPPSSPPPPPATSGITIGSRVKTTANLNVRSSASARGSRLCVQRRGSLGTVTSGPKTANGYTWWQVNFDSRCDGWVVRNYLTTSLALVTDEDTEIAHVDTADREAQLAAAIAALQSILEQIRVLQGR